MTSLLGVDLGGTKIALTRYHAGTWEVQETIQTSTHADQSFQHVYADLLQLIREYTADDTDGVGVGVPGLVRQPEGSLVTLPNISGAEETALAEKLRQDLSLRVSVDNDANCFALAEALQGSGKDRDVVVGVTMGTGVGGGIVINGTLFHGGNGFAGEIGHMLLQPGHPPYETDDRRGEVEQFFSGTAMGKRCEAAGRPEEYMEGDVCSFMREDIFREVAWMCVNLTHLIDPSVIVFGGSAGKALQPYLDRISEQMYQWALPETPLPELAIAGLGDAATRGAALLLKQ